MIGLKDGNNILFEIKDQTLIRVEKHKKSNLVEKYKGDSKGSGRSFREAISSSDLNVIAEFKRASPSAGDIARHLSSDEVAQQYISSGAKAISVITEPDFFSGRYDYLLKIRNTFSNIPILMKDFIVDKYQIDLAKEIGASSILLISSLLEKEYAKDLYHYAKSLDLDVLVEIHSLKELDEVMFFEPDIIGVNNRDLQTMNVDIKTSLEIIKNIPPNIVRVSESGIKSYDEIRELKDSGFNAFLIGTSLMKSGYPGNALKELLKHED